MPSLGEAYDRGGITPRDRTRVVLGATLVVGGALGLVAAIAVLTTPLAGGDRGLTAVQRLAGTLAGLGVPALLLGVVVVLPARRRERVGAAVGTAGAVVGVGLFRYAYPTRWTGTGQSLALPTALVYFLGSAVALWFVFAAVATFTARNQPGGTVTLSVRRRDETRTVEVSHDEYEQAREALRDGGEDEQVIRDLLDE
jgi:hypothetical protein